MRHAAALFSRTICVGLACASELQAAGSTDLGSIHRGEPLSAGAPKSVSQLLTKASSLNGQKVKVEGTVESVCQPKGCWFVLQGAKASEKIRITSKGYLFFVPNTIAKRKATVEGVFKVSELTVEKARHYEEDRVQGTGEKPLNITAPVKEFTLAATGVDVAP